jgi:hypothetical protein
MKKTFSISEAISFGWNTFKSNWKFWIVAFALFIAAGSSGINLSTNSNISSQTEDGDNINVHNDVGQVYKKEEGNFFSSSLSSVGFLKKDVLGVSTTEATELKGVPSYIWFLIPIAIILSIIMIPILIIMGLVSVIFRMGFINLTLDAVRGKQVYYKTLLNQVSFKKAIRLVLAEMLVSLMVVFGLLFFIIPGVIFALKYFFVPLIIVDQDLSAIDSLKKSNQLTKGVRFKILGLVLVFCLLAALGLLVLGVGLAVSFIVASLAQAYVYNNLVEGKNYSEADDDNLVSNGNPSEGVLSPVEISIEESDSTVSSTEIIE